MTNLEIPPYFSGSHLSKSFGHRDFFYFNQPHHKLEKTYIPNIIGIRIGVVLFFHFLGDLTENYPFGRRFRRRVVTLMVIFGPSFVFKELWHLIIIQFTIIQPQKASLTMSNMLISTFKLAYLYYPGSSGLTPVDEKFILDVPRRSRNVRMGRFDIPEKSRQSSG